MQISAGKLWSLRRLSDARGFFTMIAVDQRPGVEQLVAERHGSADWEEIGKIKRLLIQELSPYASAMLLDPQYAFPYAHFAVDPTRGLLITLEQFACEEGPGGRKTLIYPGWSVAKIKRLGADGVKLMLWYRPDASPEVLAHQHALVEQVGRECREHDIAFLLEPLVYPLGGSAAGDSYHEDSEKRPEMVIATVEEFRKERYGVDIFKLETPIAAKVIVDPDDGSAEAAETQAWFSRIDAMLDRPWVMLSAGAAMEPFRRILTYAFRAGASGYLAGRAIWWPAALEYPDWDAFRSRVREHGLPYVALVQSLLTQHGRPWTAKPAFAGEPVMAHGGPDFLQNYQG
ncbi:tagatose 1,6-diphosphate aldolase [Roseomonas sp. WA12]